MKFSIITLFPELIQQSLDYSILKRAKEKGLVEYEIIDLRKFGIGSHKSVDDRPYGGGAGMILRVDVLKKAIDSVRLDEKNPKIVLLCPQGEVYTQNKAIEFSKQSHLILVCGHYEGFDERIREFVDLEISIGDYVLTGGELPSLILVDSIVRLIPGVLKKSNATELESFSSVDNKILLEGPQYTRPNDFEGKKVPEIYLSGNPVKINEYKLDKAIKKTKIRRPDLLSK